MDIQRILEILAALANASGLPYSVLAAALIQVVNRIIQAEKERTGKTTEEIYQQAGITLDEAEAKLIEDIAKGE